MDLADLDQSVVMRQGGWSPMSPLHHLIDLFEVDFEYSVPPKIVSTKYTGRTDEFPDEDYVAFGFNKLVEGKNRWWHSGCWCQNVHVWKFDVTCTIEGYY